MNDKYLSQNGDTDECEICIPIKTKNRAKGLLIADEIVNELLTCITIVRRTKTAIDNPLFLKNIAKIEKLLWKCLK